MLAVAIVSKPDNLGDGLQHRIKSVNGISDTQSDHRRRDHRVDTSRACRAHVLSSCLYVVARHQGITAMPLRITAFPTIFIRRASRLGNAHPLHVRERYVIRGRSLGLHSHGPALLGNLRPPLHHGVRVHLEAFGMKARMKP